MVDGWIAKVKIVYFGCCGGGGDVVMRNKQ